MNEKDGELRMRCLDRFLCWSFVHLCLLVQFSSMPIAFVGMYDGAAVVAQVWKDVWDDHTAGNEVSFFRSFSFFFVLFRFF